MHSSSSSFSASTLIQYAFFAVVVYVLAGAPLSSIVSESYSGGGTGVGSTSVAREKIESLVVPERDLACGEHKYTGVHILSREPLVVYIEGFLGEEEARHVVEIRYVDGCNLTSWAG
jgi:prolyl 4-hydroxylase